MVNKVTLVGNVGNDPEVKTVGNGKVATFSIATTEKGYKSKSGVDIPDRTEWHRIVVWGPTVAVVEDYVRKGMQLYIEGKLTHRDYVTKDGEKRYITDIRCVELKMLGRKPDGAQNHPQNNNSAPPPSSPEPIQYPDEPQDDLPF